MKRSFGLSAGALCLFAGTAAAQVSPIGEFSGAFKENFDDMAAVIFTPSIPDVFDAQADMTCGACHTTGGWGFFCTIFGRSAPLFFGDAGGGGTTYIFDEPAGRFGGYFGTNSGTDGARVLFYDESLSVVAELQATTAGCTWTWNGWEFSVGIKQIQIIGNNPFGGGFVDMDDMEMDGFGGGGGCDCVCNYDTSTGTDVCDFFDFINFQDLFAAGDPCGCDLDTSTGVGVCDFFDFINFQDLFSVGC